MIATVCLALAGLFEYCVDMSFCKSEIIKKKVPLQFKLTAEADFWENIFMPILPKNPQVLNSTIDMFFLSSRQMHKFTYFMADVAIKKGSRHSY